MAYERKFCCDEFAKEAGQYRASVGGIGLYGASAMPDAQFERCDDGTWAVNGCCGGGCFVVTGMKFCPFCGSCLHQQATPTCTAG